MKNIKTHNLKLNEMFCDDVLNHRKTFEVRYNDRGYQTGDYVKFTAVSKNGLPIAHPINNKTYEILYVLSGWGIADNFVVFSIGEEPLC